MGIIWGNKDKCRGISEFLFTLCLESHNVVTSSDTEPCSLSIHEEIEEEIEIMKDLLENKSESQTVDIK